MTVFNRAFCNSTPERKEVRNVETHEMREDMVMMKDGKMMMMKHGELKPLDMVVRLSNGARVAMDGTVTMPDGTSRMLMDGEAMTMDGEMTTMEDMKDRPSNQKDAR
jgi:hypothetical protein